MFVVSPSCLDQEDEWRGLQSATTALDATKSYTTVGLHVKKQLWLRVCVCDQCFPRELSLWGYVHVYTCMRSGQFCLYKMGPLPLETCALCVCVCVLKQYKGVRITPSCCLTGDIIMEMEQRCATVAAKTEQPTRFFQLVIM